MLINMQSHNITKSKRYDKKPRPEAKGGRVAFVFIALAFLLSLVILRVVYFTTKNQEKYLLDLELAVKITLIKNGVSEKNIFSTGLCTLHSKVEGYDFCSYRRTKSKTERMLTAIMMK